jgi:hypothetical protein
MPLVVSLLRSVSRNTTTRRSRATRVEGKTHVTQEYLDGCLAHGGLDMGQNVHRRSRPLARHVLSAALENRPHYTDMISTLGSSRGDKKAGRAYLQEQCVSSV